MTAGDETPTPPRVAYVLGGGGKWGAVQVGMLSALVEAGVRPDAVYGCSIGAINGAVFAAQPDAEGVARLRQAWSHVSSGELFSVPLRDRIRTVVRQRAALHDPSSLRRFVVDALPVATFEQLAVPFECVASSIEAATERWFDRGPLVDALMASSAIPGLLPPVLVNGEHLYDGGLVNSVPVDRAVAAGASVIHVLQVGRLEQPLRPPRRLYEAGLVAFEISRRHRFTTSMRDLPDHVTVHVLPSGNPVAFDDRRQLRWRDLSGADDLMDSARVATAAYLSEVMS